MTGIWTADMHLDDNPRNKYRWEILPWLEKKAIKYQVDMIGIDGDLTDAKDRHSAQIVNRIVDFLNKSKNQWVIVKGNHDFVDPNCPFFGFLDCLENVRWITNPAVERLPIRDYEDTLLLPATKHWEQEWAPLLAKKSYKYIFMHGTFEDTPSESGFLLSGIPPAFFDMKRHGRVYAGDVHVPSVIVPRIESLGAPYRVRFGDSFEPRVVMIGQNRTENLYPNLMMRHVVVIRRAADLETFEEVEPGDQVKIRVRIKKADYPEWKTTRREIRKEAEQLGWEVCGIELAELLAGRARLEDPAPSSNIKSPSDYVREYGIREKLKQPDIEFGVKLLQTEATK